MTDSQNWQVLAKLRQLFLDESPQSKSQDYWFSTEALELYDLTFAQRISWKWEAVLQELQQKQVFEGLEWRVLDWGCGSGIASRTLLKQGICDPAQTSVYLYDRSSKALSFALKKAKEEAPLCKVAIWDKQQKSPNVLLLSHVINEVSEIQLLEIQALIRQADLTIWVEPGTHAISRKLITQRELLKEDLRILAPCPHQLNCGMLKPENAQHWCHNFAEPPSEVFQSAFWNRFSKEMHIDLRSLSVSFLVLAKDKKNERKNKDRVIGRAKRFKPYQHVLLCGADGGRLIEKDIMKRDAPQLFKSLNDSKFCFELDQA